MQGCVITLYVSIVIVARGSPLRARVRACCCCREAGEDKGEGDLSQGMSSLHHCVRQMRVRVRQGHACPCHTCHIIASLG